MATEAAPRGIILCSRAKSTGLIMIARVTLEPLEQQGQSGQLEQLGPRDLQLWKLIIPSLWELIVLWVAGKLLRDWIMAMEAALRWIILCSLGKSIGLIIFVMVKMQLLVT